MIKAEVISHEGSPGPNWLDRCRTVATPTNITVVLLLIVAGGLFIGITRHEQTSTANQQSTSSASQSQRSIQPGATSLQVQPLQQEITTNNGNTAVQSATGGEMPVTNPNMQDNSANTLGAAKTPALNSSNNSNKKRQVPVNNSKRSRGLQSQLQSTTRSIDNVLSSLGL